MFMQPSEEEEAEELKNLGNEQYKRGKFEKAVDFYTQAIGLCPGQKEYFGNRVLTLLKLERYDEALADCDSIKMLDSEWPKGMHLRGLVLEKLERLSEAKREFERLLEIDPKHKVGITRLEDLNKRLGVPAKKKKKTEKPAASKPASKSAQTDEKRKIDKKVQTLTALNKKLMQQFQESRKENQELKKKIEKLEKSPKQSKLKKEEKANSEELKKLQKKLKEIQALHQAQEDENTQLRQSINKLHGKKMGKWDADVIFKMMETHTNQLQSLQNELRRRFGKKRGSKSEL